MGREDAVDGGGQVDAPHMFGLAQYDWLLPQWGLHFMGMNWVADGYDDMLGCNEDVCPFVEKLNCRSNISRAVGFQLPPRLASGVRIRTYSRCRTVRLFRLGSSNINNISATTRCQAPPQRGFPVSEEHHSRTPGGMVVM